MTALREAVTLPAVFLTVVLLGSIQPGDPLRFVPPPLFALILAMLLVAALVQSGALAPDRLMSADRSSLANLNGLVVVLALFAASAVAIAVVLPASGVPAILMGILWLALLAQALAIGADRTRALRGLMVSFAVAFTLKFIVLASLSAPAAGRMSRIVQLLFEGVTFGTVTQPVMPPIAGYVAFATLLLYLFGLLLLPAGPDRGTKVPRYIPDQGDRGTEVPRYITNKEDVARDFSPAKTGALAPPEDGS